MTEKTSNVLYHDNCHDGGMNVARIAEQYGGGGHRGSAGFQVPDLAAIGL